MRTLRNAILLSATLVVAGLALGLIGQAVFGWEWLTTSTLVLSLIVLGTIALAVFDAGHPPAWGGGTWSSYIEMSGHEARGSGPSDMTKPASAWNFPLLVAALGPLVTIVVLLLVAWYR